MLGKPDGSAKLMNTTLAKSFCWTWVLFPAYLIQEWKLLKPTRLPGVWNCWQVSQATGGQKPPGHSASHTSSDQN